MESQKVQMVTQPPEGALLGNSAITSCLRDLGYPKKSIDSLLKCGQEANFKFIKTCGCGNKVITAQHHCNLRFCHSCSKIRKRKISRKYYPYLNSLHKDRKHFLYFLTISPRNYTSLSRGLQHIKDSWSKFIDLKYVKERVRGGFYVIETKGGEGNWNIHLHAIIYGRWLDNKIRNKKDSRIVRLFKESSSRAVNIHITRQNSTRYTLNYMLKYISANKDEFKTPYDMAKYITITRRRRLIHSFGSFYANRKKIIPEEFICKNCDCKVEFILDYEAVRIIEDYELVEKPPPDIHYYI